MQSLKYTVIKNRGQYDEYCATLEELIAPDKINNEAREEIELLTILIEKWYRDNSVFNDPDPVQIIISLKEDHGLNADRLKDILEISKSYLSEMLNYRKSIPKDVIRKLALHFKMAQEAFNRPYPLKLMPKKRMAPQNCPFFP